jgi:hypothetical protein
LLKVNTPAVLNCLSYQWQLNGTNIGSSNNVTYQARVSGDYKVIVSNSDGACSDTSLSSLTITVNPLPIPLVTADGAILTTDSFASYQWYRNNSAISGATNRSYTASRDGNYKVSVTDANGCTGMSSGKDLTDIVGVSFIAESNIRIYPNPADNFVYVDAPTPINISVTAMDGKLVQQYNNVKAADISKLSDGLYMIRITDIDNNLLLVEKLVKGTAK